MSDYTKEELQEALRAIISTISKCEKTQITMAVDDKHKSQHTLLERRIKALKIAEELITRELESSQ